MLYIRLSTCDQINVLQLKVVLFQIKYVYLGYFHDKSHWNMIKTIILNEDTIFFLNQSSRLAKIAVV